MKKSLILGGGCFWGLEDLIRKQPGILDTTVGYAGGSVENPTYENHEGHAEVVKIDYDDTQTSMENILDFFFRVHNPTTLNRQGNDTGSSYRSVIFFSNDTEKQIAEGFIKLVNESGRWDDPVVTTVEPLESFTEAEDYHQDYLVKNPGGYTCHYVRDMQSYLE